MAGEFFQAERGQISSIEAQATKEKKTDIASDIQKQKDLFQGEVSKAGKMLADADSKVTLKESKDKVSAYKADITDTLTQIVDSGRRALKAENPEGDLAVMEMLAGSLKAETGKVKQYVPLFNDVEAGKAFVPQLEEKLKKVRDAKKAKGIGSQEFNKAFMDAEDVMGKASESEVYKWKPEALPADMQNILNAVLMPLKEEESEIAGYRLERTQDSALADGDDEKIVDTDDDKTKEWKSEILDGKAALRKLKPARAAFEDVQPQMKKISDAVKEAKGDPSKAAGISDDADKAMTDLGKVLKDLKAIDREKINDPSFQALYDNLLGKTQLQLQDLANVKLSVKTSEFLKNGLTEEEKKYVTVDDKGNLVKTAEFNKLPKDKQMAFEAKFKLIEIQVSMELDEKTCTEKEKSMVEGRKKMMNGDVFGGKEDLLKYYNSAAKDTERDPVRFEQCKEMLKQIAMMELAQMVQRLAQMKEAVKERYNNNVVGKTDFGTWTYDQANDNINNMALVLAEAQRMIEKGECVTIEGAEAKLRKLNPDSIRVYESKDSLNQQKEDILKKDDATLQKEKDDLIKRFEGDVTRAQSTLDSLIAGDSNSFAVRIAIQDYGGITPEYIQKYRDKVQKAEGALASAKGMSLEAVRNGQLQSVAENMRKLNLQGALKQWQAGFPVDIKSNSWEVFDMFVQQRKLNDADPEKRKQATLEEAKKARERGFSGLARSLYEDYFADELKIGAKDVDKNKVRTDTLGDKDNIKKLNKSLDTWKESFEKQNGRKPSDEEVADARGKMENIVVNEAYNKKVKLSTYSFMKDQVGEAGNEWRKVYGGTVAIEDFGQGGPLTAFWTDEQWNALPVKVGVMTAVTIASAGFASGAVAVAGAGARAGLVAVLGESTVAGFFGVVGETGVTVGGTLAGRGLVFAGEAVVEGAAFGAAQYELNGMIMGYDYPRFSAEYWTGIGHSVVTMGVLKGVGMGVGKLKNLSEGANAAKYLTDGGLVTEGAALSGDALKLYGGGGLVEGFAKDSAWWLGKTSAEGGAMVGLDMGSAFLTGRHFTLKEGLASFGSNFVYAGLIGGVHEFMGHVGPEGPAEKQKPKIKEEFDTVDAIGKASKAHVEVDIAQAKIDKAKAEGKPTEKLEADLKKKQEQAKEADTKMGDAEKKEGEARKENMEKTKKLLEDEIAKQQKEGKVDPNLLAQLKITEALLGSIKGEGDTGAERTPGSVKIDIETLGIFQKYTEAVLGKDGTTIAELRSLYPRHAEMFGLIDKQANSVKTPRDAVIMLITGEVGSAVAGKKLNTPEEIAQFVADYNSRNKPVAEGEAQVVAKLPEGKGVLYIDKNGKLQFMEKSAADTHFESVFSSGVPDSALENGPNGQKMNSKEVPAWIDTDGKVHYNSEYFQAKYGVEMKQVEGKDGRMVNVFVVDGVEMSPKEFFKKNPKGKEVLEEMKQKKDHEVTHRLLETADKASGGKLGERLIGVVNADAQLSALFASRGVEMNARNVQEFLCEIADGRVEVSPTTKALVESSISGDIPGFSFDKVRQIDTQRLKFTNPEDFQRSTADAFSARDPILDNPQHQKIYADYLELMKKRPDLQGKNAEIRKILGPEAFMLLKEYAVAKQYADKYAETQAKSTELGKQLLDLTFKVDPKDRKMYEQIRDTLFAALNRGEYADALAIISKSAIYQKYKSHFEMLEQFQKTKDQIRALEMIADLGSAPIELKQKLIKESHLLSPDKVNVLKAYAKDAQDVDTILHHDDPDLMHLLSRDTNGYLADQVEIILNAPSLFKSHISPEKLKFLEKNIDSQYLSKDLVEKMLVSQGEKIEIDGKTFQYYPDKGKEVGEGGIGIFYRVVLVDPITGKLRFAGVKILKPGLPAEMTLGSEADGAKLVSDVVAKEKANGAENLFAKPIAVSSDKKMIFYELVDYLDSNGRRTSKDSEKLFDDPNVPVEVSFKGLFDGATALSLLHKNGLVHGDFKAAQIFSTDTGGKLGDFGTVVPFDAFYADINKPDHNWGTQTIPDFVNAPVYFGKRPMAFTPWAHSGVITDVISSKGPQYAWKFDAFALGTQIEGFLNGSVTLPRGTADNKFDPSSPVFYTYSNSPKPMVDPVAQGKFLEIAAKLKDPNNLTYTVADAVRDMKPYIKQ